MSVIGLLGDLLLLLAVGFLLFLLFGFGWCVV